MRKRRAVYENYPPPEEAAKKDDTLVALALIQERIQEDIKKLVERVGKENMIRYLKIFVKCYEEDYSSIDHPVIIAMYRDLGLKHPGKSR